MNDDDLYEKIDFNIDEIKKNIPSFSSQKLCEMIVSSRYFKYENIDNFCMEELSKRRESGNTFEFESYIDSIKNELPDIDLIIPNIKNMLNLL